MNSGHPVSRPKLKEERITELQVENEKVIEDHSTRTICVKSSTTETTKSKNNGWNLKTSVETVKSINGPVCVCV